MPHPFIDNLPEYRFPGINPPRPGVVTFSAQRFHPSLAAPQDSGILGQPGQYPTVVDPTAPSTASVLMAPFLRMAVSSAMVFYTLLILNIFYSYPRVFLPS